ncbi:uncharacterized protein LOC111290629 isoform X2 [Durio zibethinus]|uniref:Uncharacterized protein LOC111290629 isoform X2 n=1 Tax=Durio zibethinus TaxID=66656 RepID=A0A6P5YBI6_DURZI|nr:uncharacterized protein LOC111290629 isoform X2 [Durio zibethinus]
MLVRNMSRSRAVNVRKINPKVCTLKQGLCKVGHITYYGQCVLVNTVGAFCVVNFHYCLVHVEKGGWYWWIKQQNTHEDNSQMDEGEKNVEVVLQPNL